MSDTKYEQMTFEFESRPPIKGYPNCTGRGSGRISPQSIIPHS